MRRVHRATSVLAILLAAPLLAQQKPEASYILRGRVVAADDPALTLRGARIVTQGGAAAPVFADEAGEFRVSVPADYSLAISKAGFAPAVVTGRATAASADLTIRLARGAVIDGQVVDTSGFPVPHARVRARRVDAAGIEFTAEVDDAGAYRIGNLPAGRYEIHAERTPIDSMSAQPFINMQLHERMLIEMEARQQQEKQRASAPVVRMSPVTSVDLATGGQATSLLVYQTYAVLPPDAPIGGFVSGMVVDEFGDPMAGVAVRLWHLRYSADRYFAQPVGVPRLTDDRGRYRMFFVRPGRYIVAATVDDSRVAPVYYPGVTTIGGAAPIEVGRREEVPGVAIQFRRAYEARVYGFALNASGAPLRGSMMLQARRHAGQIAMMPRIAAVNPDSTFEFLNVPPGDYVLASVQANGSGAAEFAHQFISVDGPDVPPVTVRTGRLATITGRMEVEGPGATPVGGLVAVVDADYPGRMPIASFAADGTFQIANLAGPIRFTSPPDAPRRRWLKAVNIGGVNAVDEPVVFSGPDSSRAGVTVIFADTAGDLSGRVLDEREDRAEDYRVIVFSTNRDRWFARSQYLRIVGGPDADDGFTVTALPPGEYFAAAVDGIDGDMDNGDWQNPDVLAALSTRAQRVTVGERQRASADLRLIRWAR
jgi:hypothetical protein